MERNAPSPTMPPALKPRAQSRRQRGAILIESLVALAILSLGAAAMFRAFDHLEATNYAANQLGVDARTQLEHTETR